MVNAGKLRHRLTILELVSEQDSDTGEMVDTWAEFAVVWGSFEPLSVRERLTAGSIQDQTSARAMVRYRSDLSSGMRILFREKFYDIVGQPLPDPAARKEHLTLMLREIEAEDA